MWPEPPPMAVKYHLSPVSVCIMWPVYCTAIDVSSGHMIRTRILSIISIINKRLLNSNNNRSKPKFGCVFAEYNLFKT